MICRNRRRSHESRSARHSLRQAIARDEGLPLFRGEDESWACGVVAVTQRHEAAAAFAGIGEDRDLHSGAAVPAADIRLAPGGTGLVQLSIAFHARSMEACRG